MKNVQIPNPCSENWEMMSLSEKGRFCSVCNKCVIDFTDKQPEEIKQIFIEKKGDNICGRFYNHQLNNNETDTSEKIKMQFFKYIPFYFQNNRIALIVFSLILFLIGCSKKKGSFTTTDATIVDMEIDSVRNKHFLIGETIVPDDKEVARILKNDSIAKSKSD